MADRPVSTRSPGRLSGASHQAINSPPIRTRCRLESGRCPEAVVSPRYQRGGCSSVDLSAQTLDAYQSRIVTKQLATLARKPRPSARLSLVSWRRARIVPGAHIVAASNTRNSLEHCVTRYGKVYVPNSRQSDAVRYLAVQSTEWC